MKRSYISEEILLILSATRAAGLMSWSELIDVFDAGQGIEHVQDLLDRRKHARHHRAVQIEMTETAPAPDPRRDPPLAPRENPPASPPRAPGFRAQVGVIVRER